MPVASTHSRSFKIPFLVEPGREAEIELIKLFVSRDFGKTWSFAEEVKPEARCFRFRAPENGIYWFGTQIVTTGDQLNPENPGLIKASLILVVNIRAG